MTIIKPQVTEKKPDCEVPLAEVVFDDLLEKKEEVGSDVEAPIAVLAIRRRRRFNACAIILLLCIIIVACIGGIFLYKHFTHRRMRFVCGNSFYHDEVEPVDDEKVMGRFGPTPGGLASTTPSRELIKMNEEVEVDVDNQMEKFDIPRVGPYRPIQVVYDFEKNMTAILDKEQQACFVKPLNRALVRPPVSMLDFLLKLRSNYYISRSKVSREDYYIEKPAVEDVRQFGSFIFDMCHRVPTFRLRKIEPMPTPMAQQSENRRHESSSEDDDDHDHDDDDDDKDDDGSVDGHHGPHGHGGHGHHGHRHGGHGGHGGMMDGDGGMMDGNGGMMDRKKRSAADPICYAAGVDTMDITCVLGGGT